MYCPNCGKEKKETDRFCSNCGRCFQEKNQDKNQNKNQEKNQNTSKEKRFLPNQNNISAILGIIAIVCLGNPLLSIPLAISSIIFGVRAFKETNQKSIGMFLGGVSIIISVAFIGLIRYWNNFSINNSEPFGTSNFEIWIEEFYQEEQQPNSIFEISGYSWLAEDDSTLYLENNKKYIWYQQEDNKKDNFSEGTYETYQGEEALEYISGHLEFFGIQEEEKEKFFQKSILQLENYYVLILYCDKNQINGQEELGGNIIYYHGYYDTELQKLVLTDGITQEIKTFHAKEALMKIDI